MHEFLLSGVARRGEADPYYNNVNLLMPMSSSPFSDVKGLNVENQNVTLVSEGALFGGAASFNGVDSVLRIVGNPLLAMDNAHFTQEIWVKPFSYPAAGRQDIIFTTAPSTGTQFAETTIGINLQPGGNVRVQSSYSVFLTGSRALPLNQWTLLSISRVAGNMYLFQNGNVDASGANNNVFSSTTEFLIGKEKFDLTDIGQSFHGLACGMRITKPIGRYSNNFPLPTEAWPRH